MSLFNDIQKFKQLDRLIRFGETGPPDELAKKMQVSRATLFRIIDRFKKEFDAPIYFDKNINSYYYEYPGKLIIKFKETNPNDKK